MKTVDGHRLHHRHQLHPLYADVGDERHRHGITDDISFNVTGFTDLFDYTNAVSRSYADTVILTVAP